mmetsp:Transcript_21575/g.44302  ORF Transcript_21575/g.44302 Transcript_21575/m.44302 type:complete len:184 (-) Transcript_21575:170-721(-)
MTNNKHRRKSSSPSTKPKKRQKNNLSLQTFRTLLMALLICAWDLRESDRHASVELYKVVIKCYNALRSSHGSGSSDVEQQDSGPSTVYMGMHLVDSRAAMDNPKVMASVLQAVVNLESLLGQDDEWKEKLKRLGVSIAQASCLGGGIDAASPPSPSDDAPTKPVAASLSFFDMKALKTARSWH